MIRFIKYVICNGKFLYTFLRIVVQRFRLLKASRSKTAELNIIFYFQINNIKRLQKLDSQFDLEKSPWITLEIVVTLRVSIIGK